jgi:hypothetical protein
MSLVRLFLRASRALSPGLRASYWFTPASSCRRLFIELVSELMRLRRIE